VVDSKSPVKALVAERATLESDLAQRSEAGFFSHAIDDAATARHDQTSWSLVLKSFDAFDVVEIAVVLNIVAYTIQKEVGAGAVTRMTSWSRLFSPWCDVIPGT
jgi:hypothetical protein